MITKQGQTYRGLQHEVLEPSELQYSILRLSGVTAFTNVSTVYDRFCHEKIWFMAWSSCQGKSRTVQLLAVLPSCAARFTA